MKFNKRKLILLFCLMLFSVNFISCNNNINDNIDTKGFIWVASKDNITINLIGTIHPAPPSLNFFNNDVNEILENTDILSVEVDTTNPNNSSIKQKLLSNNTNTNAKDILSNDEIQYLETLLASPNFDLDYLSTLPPISVISLIDRAVYSKENYSTSFDSQLLNRSKKMNIEINELENLEFQVKLINNSYTWQDVKDYIATNRDPKLQKASKDYLAATFDAYIKGNIEFFENDLKKVKIEKPDFYEEFVTKRNIAMAQSIDSIVKDGRRHTIAIGCKHFIGADSVLTHLKKLGYKVTRL